MTLRPAILLFGAAALSACVSEAGRIDGVTSGAGNAIAANTVMQMVDPWPRGVEETDLDVPADRPAPASGEADSGASSDN